jgi:multidrug efflux pump subunit AcrB
MSLWDLCIKRPVFTVMLVSAPIVLGLVGRSRLGVDLLPNVDMPVVVVTTTLKGAGVEEMETSVTKPIEQIINTVSGIDELKSTTKEGISQVVVVFFLEKNRDVAAQEVRDKISTILAQLPVGTDPPIIDKLDLNAMPVMQIAVAGQRPMQEITEIARKKIKEDLESVSGVGAVIIVGGRQRAVNIYIDTDKLTSCGLSIEDVRQALIRQNLEMPGGRVDQGSRELVLRTMGRVEKTSGFLDLIVANRGGYPIRIRDLVKDRSKVQDSFEEPRSLARLDGRNAVSLIVQKQSGSNTVAVVERVRKRFEQLQAILPPDIETFVVKDQSKFIVNSIEELNFHLVIAAILVAATILVFIQDWRTTIIASLAIPASIVATFAFMYWMGYTLNNMTMLGLILAIGIVIDDAVVINENVFRHMEEHGWSAMKSASSATKEIALAVSATTLSLLVIFLPIVFMGGRIGRFFSSFGATVAFAILMSWFVSFTMTPMLCSRFLKLKQRAHGGSKEKLVWRVIDQTYGWILGWSLRHRWVIVLTTVGLLAATVYLFKIVGFDFIPRDDQSEFEVAITLPEGYTLEQGSQVFADIEGRLAQLKGVQNVFSTIGDTTGRVSRGQGDVTAGTIYCRLVDLEERTRKWYDWRFWYDGILRRPESDPRYYSQFDVQREARNIMEAYPDLRTAVQDAAVVSGAGFRQAMVDLNLRGPDLNKLVRYSDQIMRWMRQDPEAGFLVDETPGVRVMAVTSGSPAAQAGIVAQDLLASVNKQTVRSREQLAQALEKTQPGDRITVGLVREGQERDVKVTLGTPATELGLDTAATVAVVRKGGPAELAGLLPGDLITAFQQRPVGSAADITQVLQSTPPGASVEVQVARAGAPQTLALTLGPRSPYVDMDTSLSLRKPELRVKIDREKASDLGIPVQTIASTLNVLVGGEPVTKYKELDEQYDVWLRADLPYRDRAETIGRLMVPSPKAGLVEISSLATLTPAQGPATIDRFGMQRQVVVTANLEGDKALSDAVRDVSLLVDSLGLPTDYRYEFLGRAKVMGESNQNFLIAFLTSFLFMYMILAAQFESFVHPITILLALPLTLPFALISLILLRTNLNLYAMFGLFMLFGIVKKNGILQVDFTNVLRRRGVPKDEAILEANHTRLRPILMTTVMLIAAMVPIALGRGPGAASRASLAKVILGGQTLSLLLTLLVTPVAYSLWEDLTAFLRRVFPRLGRGEEMAESADATVVLAHEAPAPAPAPLVDEPA